VLLTAELSLQLLRLKKQYELTSTPPPPELVALAAYVSEDGLVGHHWKERPISLVNFICLSTGERQGQEVGVWGGGGKCGGGGYGGTFVIALEM
jgi:hypothetical protein